MGGGEGGQEDQEEDVQEDLSLIDVSEGAIEEERKLMKEREEEKEKNQDQTKEIPVPSRWFWTIRSLNIWTSC